MNTESAVQCAAGIAESAHERNVPMARKRYQKGSVSRRGDVWYGRWWEDVIENGERRRRYRSERLGTVHDYPTQRLARRALDPILARVNSPLYRGVMACGFASFCENWQERVLPQLKPSTALNYRVILSKHLVPFFGNAPLGELTGESVQHFVSQSGMAPKTVRNCVMVLRSLWRSAGDWGYVRHDPFRGLRLPRLERAERPPFTVEEIRRVLAAASEPFRTFCWIAAETGLRAGELCGLWWDDADFGARTIRVRQSVWRGRLQQPKSAAAARVCAISEPLAEHLRSMRGEGLMFSTRNGTPWDANLIVKRKLHPLLDSLGIPRRGLHAFRHAQASLMDAMHVPVKVRQQRLGHASSQVTLDTYTHVVTEDERRFADELGRILHANERRNESGLAVTPAKPLVMNELWLRGSDLN